MTKNTSWSYSAGEKGRNRVRAFADPKTGILLLEWYEQELGAKPRRKRISTGHRDRTRAKQAADELAAAFATRSPARTEGLTLYRLFEIYLGEVSPTKGGSKRTHDVRCAEMFLAFLGANRKPETLNRRDWDQFVRERRSGAVAPVNKTFRRPVRNRTIAYDLAWLRSVLNWACLAGSPEGGMLLDRNPLKGLPLPREDIPQSQMVSEGRYRALRAVADQVAPGFRLALVLANETGHRIGSIRQLRWSDVDFRGGRVRVEGGDG
jgi:integrase